MLGIEQNDVNFNNEMVTNHLFKNEWFYNLLWTSKFIEVMKRQNNLSAYEILNELDCPTEGYFYLALSYNDEYQCANEINLNLHRPKYALIYNNIIQESIVDNSYYKILKSIYFESSDTKWKTISFKNDEFVKIQEKTPLYLEFALRLSSGDLVEFENEDDDVIINLKVKNI